MAYAIESGGTSLCRAREALDQSFPGGSRWRKRVWAAALAGLLCAGSGWSDYGKRADVLAYVDELVERHGFDRTDVLSWFEAAQRKERILEAISRPAERVKSWGEYRALFLTTRRIEEGVEFWRRHESILARATREYRVAPEIVVAILGVETSYGRITGSFRVIDALATLGFDYPPRAPFFRGELTQFLLLAREENRSPLDFTGSYAGAMGYGQFIPSSYRAYAVDFDGDGRRDIWKSVDDAVGSVANYFQRHGWRGEGPVAVLVEVEGEHADSAANEGLAPNYDVAELRRLGVRVDALADDALRDDTLRDDALRDDAKAALFRMEGNNGPEYWLGLHDFYVITRYNRSAMYALAVLQLAQELRKRMGPAASAPVEAERPGAAATPVAAHGTR